MYSLYSCLNLYNLNSQCTLIFSWCDLYGSTGFWNVFGKKGYWFIPIGYTIYNIVNLKSDLLNLLALLSLISIKDSSLVVKFILLIIYMNLNIFAKPMIFLN